MSGELEKPVPPGGEELHIPEGSLHPVLLTLGITIALVGVTLAPFLIVGGVLLSVSVLYQWIRGARAEMASLPASHE